MQSSLVQSIVARINKELLDVIYNLNFDEGDHNENFNVDLLYTKAGNDGADDGILSFSRGHRNAVDVDGLTVLDIDLLLRLCFSSAVFCVDPQDHEFADCIEEIDWQHLISVFMDSTEKSCTIR
ncbi:hypothetical protein Tcan_05026 [Toxocara canis]|uniref:Uncharacterized protein n=1 Tax=Toxocara canis TaxID=6265 RepID=A0A0B2V8I1_TOXCA|nr:hypothetical protein Tcan_05026 [Toxocara canis]